LQTVQYCLAQGGRYAEASHVRLLLDCSQVCHTSEDFMLRGSDLHPLTCGVCSQVCERCAEACEAMGDDSLVKQCAEACWRCASSCAHMAGLRMPEEVEV